MVVVLFLVLGNKKTPTSVSFNGGGHGGWPRRSPEGSQPTGMAPGSPPTVRSQAYGLD
jgi:hypothetical protein